MVRWQMSAARKDFSTLVERASRGEWQMVGRRARAEVVLGFVDVWEAELRAAPNQRAKSGQARRVQLAGDRGRVAEVLFGAVPDGPRR